VRPARGRPQAAGADLPDDIDDPALYDGPVGLPEELADPLRQ
jgi:hypothetical protein